MPGNAGTSEEPDAKDIEGFEKFIENYKGAIAVEKTASEVINKTCHFASGLTREC